MSIVRRIYTSSNLWFCHWASASVNLTDAQYKYYLPVLGLWNNLPVELQPVSSNVNDYWTHFCLLEASMHCNFFGLICASCKYIYLLNTLLTRLCTKRRAQGIAGTGTVGLVIKDVNWDSWYVECSMYTLSQKNRTPITFSNNSQQSCFRTNKSWYEKSSFNQHLTAFVILWEILRTEYQLRFSCGTLCQVAGNTVIPYGRWRSVTLWWITTKSYRQPLTF